MPDITVEYLAELLKEKRQLSIYNHAFIYVERLVDNEISRVRSALFQVHFKKEEIELPEPGGEVTVLQEKIFVPLNEHPGFNFVGRILGPRGMTAKQFEIDTGCKIMVRGKGSLRDSKKEELMRGKPTWEHLDDDLHVVLQCEDTPNRAKVKLDNGVKELKKLMMPNNGPDELKRKQLMELAIINGTFRSTSKSTETPKTGYHNFIAQASMNSPLYPPGFESPYFAGQSPSVRQPILGGYNTSPVTPPVRRDKLPAFFQSLATPPFVYGRNLIARSPVQSAGPQQSAFSFNYIPPSPPDVDYPSKISQLFSKLCPMDSPLKRSK